MMMDFNKEAKKCIVNNNSYPFVNVFSNLNPYQQLWSITQTYFFIRLLILNIKKLNINSIQYLFNSVCKQLMKKRIKIKLHTHTHKKIKLYSVLRIKLLELEGIKGGDGRKWKQLKIKLFC